MPLQPKPQPPYYTPGTAVPTKQYHILLSQSGTSAPVITELKNTTGTTITSTFDSTGVFYLEAANEGTFPLLKTLVLIGSAPEVNKQVTAQTEDDPTAKRILIITGVNNAPANSVLFATALKIDIYP